jgi:hypothetical protein
MKPPEKILLISFLLLLNSCIKQFIPQTNEDKELLVVGGLITDQPDTNTIKLSRSLPLGKKSVANPVTGCIVSISDDLGNIFALRETVAGTYVTDPAVFKGAIGRSYTLHINTYVANNNHNFESYPMKMIPVPPIDSVYYEKVTIQESTEFSGGMEGCKVYLNTHDPTNQCKFYRWGFSETWKYQLYQLPHQLAGICWASSNSNDINIKNTSVLEENRINRNLVNFISNITDRLRIKYSILVNQYSLNEDEYLYWEKLQNITEQVGGLYDMIPSSIPSNIYCTDDPNQKVLGYFSVSAKSSKRIFIKDHFAGVVNPYTDDACVLSYWVIVGNISFRESTFVKGCIDCTERGTSTAPDFWIEGK